MCDILYGMSKLFGTDGIRGIANRYPITPEMCVKIAISASAYILKKNNKNHRVIIAKDTRLSGYMIESALTSGFISMGIDVMLLGPMPTPAVSMLTKSMRADLGIMISASHNPFNYNGIKIFDSDGYKLSESAETEIEERVFNNLPEPTTGSLGKCYRIDGADERYIEFVKSTIEKGASFTNLKIVIDSANGAAYKIAKTVFWELGIDVISINDEPNGYNINNDAGAMHPEVITKATVAQTANAGISLDGDADRIIMSDENGEIVDGDQIIAIIANYLKSVNQLKNDTVIVTEMTNLAMENFLKSKGITVIRTKVGDKYVIRKMLETNSFIGGEQSGHVIIGNLNSTGDGIVAGLQVLYIMSKTGKKLSDLKSEYTPCHQAQKNVGVANLSLLENEDLQTEILNIKTSHEKQVRILVRKSGTEPVIRVLVEGMDKKLINELVNKIGELIKKYDG